MEVGKQEVFEQVVEMQEEVGHTLNLVDVSTVMSYRPLVDDAFHKTLSERAYMFDKDIQVPQEVFSVDLKKSRRQTIKVLQVCIHMQAQYTLEQMFYLLANSLKHLHLKEALALQQQRKTTQEKIEKHENAC